MTDDIKPITIILTIHPLKKGKRKLDVAAAPEGELPILITGAFADRHKLADQAYAELLKRKPKVVKVADGKAKKGKTTPAAAESDETDTDAETAEAEVETGPIGPAPEAEALPVIEGDTVTLPGSVEQLAF